MAKSIARSEPVPSAPLAFNGATVALEPPLARYSLRARNAAGMESILGRSIPHRIGETADGISCLGPDEWLWRAAFGTSMPDGSGAPVSVVDISERQVAISIEGPRALDVLLSGNPLDLEKFAIGRAVRTIFEGAEIILIREGDERFVIEVWRSFAEFVWGVVVKAAAEH